MSFREEFIDKVCVPSIEKEKRGFEKDGRDY